MNELSNIEEKDELWNELGINNLTKRVVLSSIINLKKQMMELKEKNKLNDRLKKEFKYLELLFK